MVDCELQSVSFGRSGRLIASKCLFQQKWWIVSVKVLVLAEVVDCSVKVLVLVKVADW